MFGVTYAFPHCQSIRRYLKCSVDMLMMTILMKPMPTNMDFDVDIVAALLDVFELGLACVGVDRADTRHQLLRVFFHATHLQPVIAKVTFGNNQPSHR